MIVGNRVSAKAELEGLDLPEMGTEGYSGIKMDKNIETPLSKHNGRIHTIKNIPEKVLFKYGYKIYKTQKYHIVKKLIVIALIASVFGTGLSFSTPSTQIWIPSTDFQKWKTGHLGLDNYFRTSKINGVRGAGMFDLGLTTGLFHSGSFRVRSVWIICRWETTITMTIRSISM